MIPISQPDWVRYRDSARGRRTIERFERAQQPDFSPEEMVKLYKSFAPEKTLEEGINPEFIRFWEERIPNCLTNYKLRKPISVWDFCYYASYLFSSIESDEDCDITTLPQNRYRPTLTCVKEFSMLFYKYAPTFFLPYFFPYQFVYLKRIAEKYDLTVTEGDYDYDLRYVPAEQQYHERCIYYGTFCFVMHTFAKENNLTPAELCAFLYDYELRKQKDELEEEEGQLDLSRGSHVWFIGGSYEGIEKSLSTALWQSNPKTRRGDILVFYEKHPAKSINSIWRAVEDGIADPFFYYYGYTYMRDKLEVPAITLDELKADAYFSQHALVKKNMQGVNGWPMSAEDYKNLARMLEAKGFDPELLPELEVHNPPKGLVYFDRADGLTPEQVVHQKQVVPLLARMGWRLDRDFIEQVPYQVQRGKRHKNVVIDAVLHHEDETMPMVIITERYEMDTDKALEEAFNAGGDIACEVNAEIVMLVDKTKVVVVVRNEEDGYICLADQKVFYHDELDNEEHLNELRKLLAGEGEE